MENLAEVLPVNKNRVKKVQEEVEHERRCVVVPKVVKKPIARANKAALEVKVVKEVKEVKDPAN